MSTRSQTASTKKKNAPANSPAPLSSTPDPRRLWLAGIGLALLAVLVAYGPALRGEFVFDDIHMPFASTHPETLPLRNWMGSRPLVGFSYWLNYQIGGVNPLNYHLTNIVLHTFAALLVFLIVRKILELAAVDRKRGDLVAAFSAAVFLLHPVQTEAVAYISSRSENLSVSLAFSAWALFLYRRAAEIRGWIILPILALIAASASAKEHVAVLPAVLVLTDYYWNPGFSFKGVWRNWRLYVWLLAGGVALGALVLSILRSAPTVGFNMKDFTWYEYLFTQCRVLFLYARLFVLPFGQSADYAIPVSHTPLDHGAIFGMLGLIAAAVTAFVWRKRFPIASYGFFVAMLFFVPTSSFVPIKDVATERRLYLPMIGLLLIVAEFLVRYRGDTRRLTAGLASVVVLFSAITWNRSAVWSSEMALWSDTVQKTPEQKRAHFGLALAEYKTHRCPESVREYELGSNPFGNDGLFYSNWALALDCAGRLKEAVEMGRKAIALTPGAATYAIEAVFLAKSGNMTEALELLDKAEKDNPSYVPTYIERGDILMAIDQNGPARAAFEKALALEPGNVPARRALIALTNPGPGGAR